MQTQGSYPQMVFLQVEHPMVGSSPYKKNVTIGLKGLSGTNTLAQLV